MNNKNLQDSIVELYNKTACNISKELIHCYKKELQQEKRDSLSFIGLNNILRNVDIGNANKIPICQDTGVPIFYVKINKKYSIKEIKEIIISATKTATEKSILRPNAVDPFSNVNSDNNLGKEFPVIYFEEHEEDFIKIDLLLKGGGSENIGKTYSLPNTELNAQRDINGIKKCVIDAVLKAQGKGCPPYIISVAIGGSKDVVTKISKKGLLRKIDDENKDPVLNKLEKDLLSEVNKLKIGVMGFGSGNTAVAVKIVSTHRHPASFFVDVCFSCWALRKGTLTW